MPLLPPETFQHFFASSCSLIQNSVPKLANSYPIGWRAQCCWASNDVTEGVSSLIGWHLPLERPGTTRVIEFGNMPPGRHGDCQSLPSTHRCLTRLESQESYRGSALAPLLFTAFANELSLFTAKARVVQYTDVSGKKKEFLSLVTEMEPHWHPWISGFNKHSSSFLTVRATLPNFEEDFRETYFVPCSEVKNLGVIFDKHHSWDNHVGAINHRCNGRGEWGKLAGGGVKSLVKKSCRTAEESPSVLQDPVGLYRTLVTDSGGSAGFLQDYLWDFLLLWIPVGLSVPDFVSCGILTGISVSDFGSCGIPLGLVSDFHRGICWGSMETAGFCNRHS